MMILSNFKHLLPDVIFDAAETLGGRCTGRFFALNAMENRVYDIEMEDSQDHLIIKFYRPGRWSREMIEAEHAFLKKASSEEVPVVCPLSDNSGKTIFDTENIFFALFPKRPGRLEPELNPAQLEQLGRFLARLHNAGETLTSLPRKRLDAQTYGRESLDYILQEKLLAPGLGPIYQNLVTQICNLIDPALQNTTYTLTHGDCHTGNILWKNDSPYFIDFDDMIYAPPVQDIWMLTGGDDEASEKNRQVVIRAYREMRSFDSDTLRLIEPLRALRIIYFAGWIARRREDGAFQHTFPHFGTERYWQEQVETLSLQLDKVRKALNEPEP